MAEKLCTLRKYGGGRLKETVLWTNPNPSVATGFPTGDVTLSKNLSDYKYVKVTYGYAYNQHTGDNVFSAMYDVELFKKTVAPATYGFSGCLNVTHRSNGNFYDRRFMYATDTTLNFGSCFMYKNNTAATISNIFVIPLEIIGLK